MHYINKPKLEKERCLYVKITIVNALLVGDPNNKNDGWVLVDTGLENSADFKI